MEMVVMNRELWLQEGNKYEQMAIGLSIPVTTTLENF